ncbi:ankyrin-repeat protein, putative [Theileria annulata]|uniref:Ankyrin-repeat protein, putative n=1 Tax=Theileria annulata TaxID=5874 RepID=Q4UCQ1_THEAN|nr:ankyrin-repeat protein, putative [Theileria annulata]CAI75400.1 ankyrin-repeat protein, putative [Theileria annulata]|eukprot:XP_954876.1 ankyrin-repeat protein, putative [Theileria annulata]
MTEKSHRQPRKRDPEWTSHQPNKPSGVSSQPSNTFNFTEMFKSLQTSQDDKNVQVFEDQKLMSEIGKIFFTSMMQFSSIMNSRSSSNKNFAENNFKNKGKFASQNNNADFNGSGNGNHNSGDTVDKDVSLTSQYRKTKNKKSKLRQGGSVSGTNSSISQNTVNKDSVVDSCRTKSESNDSQHSQKCINKGKGSASTNTSKYKVKQNHDTKNENDAKEGDYTISTQRDQTEVNLSDFQDPTPSNEDEEKQKLNLNIYRFINNCVSVNRYSTSDTVIQNSTVEDNIYNFQTLNNVTNNNTDYSNSDVDVLSNTATEDVLLMRCFGGDLDSVMKLKDCDLEFVDQVGRSAIHYAASSGNLDLVKYLVSNGVYIDKKDVKGWTPLFIAVVKNHVEIVDLLLNYGADLSLTLRHRCAPTRLTDAHSQAIHFAAIKSNREITELLLKRGVDINEKDSQGITPLSYACYRANLEYVSFLLEQDANPKIQDVNGRTSFHSIALGGSLELAKIMHQKVGIHDTQDRWSLTPSKLAEIRGFKPLSEYLKKAGNETARFLGLPQTTNSDPDDSEDSMYQLLSSTIASALNEPNSDQIYRCLMRLGPDVVKTLFELTLKVEKSGGVTTSDGKRPKTPGGVFFTLLKQMHLNNYITKEDYDYIRAAEKERLKSVNNNSTVNANNKNYKTKSVNMNNTFNKVNNNRVNNTSFNRVNRVKKKDKKLRPVD